MPRATDVPAEEPQSFNNTFKQHYTRSAAAWEPEAWFILQSSAGTAVSICSTTTTKETAEAPCYTCTLAIAFIPVRNKTY